MSFINKFLDMIKLNDDIDDEDDFYDDSDDFEDEEEEEEVSCPGRRRSRRDEEDEEEDDYDIPARERNLRKQASSSGRAETVIDEDEEEDVKDRGRSAARAREREKAREKAEREKAERAREQARRERERSQREREMREAEMRRKAKVTSIRSQRKSDSAVSMELNVLRPSSYDDSYEIADNLLGGRTVILNLEGMGTDAAQKVIDFTSGVCYALGGNIQKISSSIFAVTPPGVDISGEAQDMLSGAAEAPDLEAQYR